MKSILTLLSILFLIAAPAFAKLNVVATTPDIASIAKEIGNDHALIFYEGVRPIRCRKIRYFADRRFRARLLPAPPRATPGSQAIQPRVPGAPPGIVPAAGLIEADALTTDTSMQPTTALHAAGLEDMERLESLTIDDFDDRLKNLHFEQAGQRPTDSELAADVDHFLDALRQ